MLAQKKRSRANGPTSTTSSRMLPPAGAHVNEIGARKANSVAAGTNPA